MFKQILPKMRIFFGKMSILKAISTFATKIEFVGVKTTYLNIFPGGIKNSTKSAKIFGGQARVRKNVVNNNKFVHK